MPYLSGLLQACWKQLTCHVWNELMFFSFFLMYVSWVYLISVSDICKKEKKTYFNKIPQLQKCIFILYLQNKYIIMYDSLFICWFLSPYINICIQVPFSQLILLSEVYCLISPKSPATSTLIYLLSIISVFIYVSEQYIAINIPFVSFIHNL